MLFDNKIWLIRVVDEIVNKPILETQTREIIYLLKDSYVFLIKNFSLTMENKNHVLCDWLYMTQNI